MKKLFITLSIALGLLGTVDANAGYLRTGGKTLVEQGRTTELNSWLTDICSATSTEDEKNTISATVAPKNNVGDVYFVSINDYWKGDKYKNAANANGTDYSPYRQINRGVDDIIKVNPESKQVTSSGTFYTHEAKNANKFFFIVRRAERKPENDGYANIAFSWYDEWSYVEQTSNGYAQLEPCWDRLSDGAPFPAPHNCGSSLENDHYITLNAKEDDDAPHYNFTAYLYVPKNINTNGVGTGQYEYTEGNTTYYIYNESYSYSHSYANSVNNLNNVYVKDENGEYVLLKDKYAGKYYRTSQSGSPVATVTGYTRTEIKKKTVPYVFFYDVELAEGVVEQRAPFTDQNNKYQVKLNWSTAFDEFATNSVQIDTQYDGMQEYYVLERSYDKTNWETVDMNDLTVEGNEVRKAANKTWTDTGLKAFTAETEKLGYTVYYRVTSKVQKSDATTMSTTTSNVITVYIPGTAPFKLTLQSGGKSEFDPMGQTNKFTNTVVGTETDAHEDVLLAANSTLQLVRTDVNNPDGVALATVSAGNANISLSDLVKKIGTNGSYTESFTTDAGEAYDATYQLVLMTPTSEGDVKYYSNYATIANAKAQNTTAEAHRSGTPDAATCADQELFHNVISFKPALTGAGTGYYIYRNGVQVADLVDNGNGTFSHRGSTEEIALVNGTLSVSDLVETNPIAAGETITTGQAEDPAVFAYSVAHYDLAGNTYGSARVGAEYLGTNGELVVNLLASSKLQYAQDYWFVYENAVLEWNMPKATYADTKPVKFEIYYKEISEVSTYAAEEGGYTYLTDVDAVEGETAYKFETKAILKEVKETPGKNVDLKDYIKSYSFYVKAITTNDESVAVNVREKNSASYAPSTEAGAVITGIEGVEMAEADVTVADGIVTVKGVDGMVAIYSATGAMVASAEADGEVEIDATGLENGVYVVKAQNIKPTKILIK